MKKFKSRLKKVITSLLVAMMMFTSLGLTSKAAGNVTTSSFISGTNLENARVWGPAQIIYVNGEESFCLQPDLLVDTGTNQNINFASIGINDDLAYKLSLIAYYGYRTQTNNTNYVLTQNLIWETLGNDAYYSSSVYPTPASQNAWQADVMNKVNSYMYSTVSFSGQTVTLKYGETVQLTDTNGVLSQMDLSRYDGLHVTKNGNTLSIHANQRDVNNTSVLLKKPLGHGQEGQNFIYGNPGSQAHSILKTEDPDNAFVNVIIKQTGTLALRKTDEVGNVVQDVTFNIASIPDMTGIVGTYTTDAGGNISVADLNAGTYYIQEISAPSHLIVDNTIHTVTITAGNTTTFNAVNTVRKGNLELTKTNEIGGLLDGAVFNVKSLETWNPYEQNHTITGGKLTVSDLPIGRYQLTEITAPENHVITKDVYDVVIEEGTTTEQVVVNRIDPRAQIIVNKTMEGEVKSTAGVEFTLTAKEDIFDIISLQLVHKQGDVIGTYTMDGTNTLEINDLYIGRYQLTETSTAHGYELDTKVYDIHFRQEDYVTAVYSHSIKLENKLMRTELEVIKLDAITGNPVLNETEFTMYTDKELSNVHQVKTTDPTTGKVLFDDLVFGSTYYIKETNAPEGYLVGDEVREVTIDDAFLMKRSRKIEAIANEKPTGVIELQKYIQNPNAMDEYLLGSNISFKLTANEDIYNPDTNTLLYQEGDVVSTGIAQDGIYMTNELGILSIGDLPLGKTGTSYLLTEVSTKEGYVLLSEPIVVVFDIVDEITTQYVNTIELTNELTTTEFLKTTITGEELPGATLQIIDKQTGEVVEEWVSMNKPHIVKGLIYGKDYIMKETIAPTGYVVAQEIEFTYSKDVEKVTMINELINSKVSTGDYVMVTMYLYIFGTTIILLSILYFKRKNRNTK